MTRITAPVSKLSRSIGSATRPSTDFPGPALLPKYAELLRHRTPKEQSDVSLHKPSLPHVKTSPLTPSRQAHSHTRGMTTRHVPAPPQPNPITLPSQPHPSPSGRRTPVPILFTPRHHPAHPGAEPARAPEVHFVSENQRDPVSDLEGIENIDVDEAARRAATS